jgi:hypothetical protein
VNAERRLVKLGGLRAVRAGCLTGAWRISPADGTPFSESYKQHWSAVPVVLRGEQTAQDSALRHPMRSRRL